LQAACSSPSAPTTNTAVILSEAPERAEGESNGAQPKDPDTANPTQTAAHPSARNRPANPHCGPILIGIETRAGHGSATPLAKRVENAADQFAFLIHTLHMNPTP
ncbi:MAG: hypothetical protein M3O02_12500, partial [Acidobacteriota bacterium]|nr:hypothetical protein [Acidobacteriota bacterium]